MKLIIQIPCLNEEATLPRVLAELPREVPGFDGVEWLVVDDGSSDGTVAAARAGGVDHIIRLTNNKGLAAAFQAGLDAALKLGAEVIVNTDADNQYRAADIPRLVEPIVAGRADMVVGDRQVRTVEHFSPAKKLLQRLATTSGGRAFFSSTPAKLDEVFAEILDDLHHQYLLAYPMPDHQRDGKWHAVKVVANGGKYRVRARQGYRMTATP